MTPGTAIRRAVAWSGGPASAGFIRSPMARGYLILTGSSAVTRLMSFLAAVILARELGPAGFGEFSLFFAVMMLLSQATGFVDSAFVRYANTVRLEDRRAYLRASLTLKVGFCLALLLAALPAGSLISRALDKPELDLVLALAVICAVALNFLTLQAAVYQAAERFAAFAALNALFPVLSLAGVLMGTAVGSSVSGPRDTSLVYVIYLSAATVVGAISGWGLVRLTKPLATTEWSIVKRLVSFSKWLIADNVVYLTVQRLDLLIVAGLADPTGLGRYAAAQRIAVMGALLTGTLSALLLPRASRTRGSPAATRRYLVQAGLISVLLSAMIAALWLAIPFLVNGLFGPGYAGAIPITRIILLGTLCIAVYTPLSRLFFAEDRPRRIFYLQVVRLTAMVALAFLLVPRAGAAGIAWAVAGTEFFALLYTGGAIRQVLRTQAADERSRQAR